MLRFRMIEKGQDHAFCPASKVRFENAASVGQEVYAGFGEYPRLRRWNPGGLVSVVVTAGQSEVFFPVVGA